ncbi:peptide/nickel transport system substrate-binding protein [Archangium gephyra]|uniref:Oligopeptide ABC transporter, periplasmic oligopeptide-binding protein OppA n=1 Tax=Archangium gephyra TaxID=48 RepID=A0AAC8TAP9_9BACT|nr:ABC transporter substrate-binding protein [Archangium gephyra]AKI98976.1 Oligopeptide ABC transporter, periplasmic oligopeptide-binding protein OppA [Archangium gephyra]REG30885.1 peptide/nickel transport system substrate-binding protein [Archangium gephyra]
MSSDDNVEWQLADLVDAISAEVDRAEDTLALKSYARKVSFAIKKIAFDVEVTMRRAPDGRLFFRSLDPGGTSDTLLKLDFAQVLESQLVGMRKPLDDTTTSAPLSTLPGITPEEIKALNAIAIYSVDDLLRYTRTSAMLAEVSRKSGIAETRLRFWRGLPFISVLKPARGAPGSSVVLEGGNFGAVRPVDAQVMFHGHKAKVLEWSGSRLTVEAPAEALGSGLVFLVMNAQPTNVVTWESTTLDVRVEEVLASTEAPMDGEPVQVEAVLVNRGSIASGAFSVQWFVDGVAGPVLPHGPLAPGERSTESGLRRELMLPAGRHTVRFVADVAEEMPGLDRAMLSFSRTVEVKPVQSLRVGDYRLLDGLDPLRMGPVDGSSVLGLVFRGLARPGPEGTLVPDLAESWTPPTPVEVDGFELYSITVTLRPGLRFHDGSPVSAEDVRFSFLQLWSMDTPWSDDMNHIHDIVLEGSQVKFIVWAPDALDSLLTMGVVPRASYDPSSFGWSPVGTGPFRVESFSADEMVLRAFRGYFRGAPRLERLTMQVVPDSDWLGEGVEKNELQLAVMPYSDVWFERLRSLGRWTLARVSSPFGEQLHVQVPGLLERDATSPDINASAYLWYVKP